MQLSLGPVMKTLLRFTNIFLIISFSILGVHQESDTIFPAQEISKGLLLRAYYPTRGHQAVDIPSEPLVRTVNTYQVEFHYDAYKRPGVSYPIDEFCPSYISVYFNSDKRHIFSSNLSLNDLKKLEREHLQILSAIYDGLAVAEETNPQLQQLPPFDGAQISDLTLYRLLTLYDRAVLGNLDSAGRMRMIEEVKGAVKNWNDQNKKWQEVVKKFVENEPAYVPKRFMHIARSYPLSKKDKNHIENLHNFFAIAASANAPEHQKFGTIGQLCPWFDQEWLNRLLPSARQEIIYELRKNVIAYNNFDLTHKDYWAGKKYTLREIRLPEQMTLHIFHNAVCKFMYNHLVKMATWIPFLRKYMYE